MYGTLLGPCVTSSWPLFTLDLYYSNYISAGITNSIWHHLQIIAFAFCPGTSLVHTGTGGHVYQSWNFKGVNTSWNNLWSVWNRNWWINSPLTANSEMHSKKHHRDIEPQFSVAVTKSIRALAHPTFLFHFSHSHFSFPSNWFPHKLPEPKPRSQALLIRRKGKTRLIQKVIPRYIGV